MGVKYKAQLGCVNHVLPSMPASIAGHLSLNTPVGSCVDHFGRVWLADTAHNRLLVMDAELETILMAFGSTGSGDRQFNMPFRLLAHPEKRHIYVTDIGNFRVHILSYDENTITPISTFGDTSSVDLKGPNGIVYYRGQLCVADEFFEGPDGVSRLVVFRDNGEYLYDIHQITGYKTPVELLWPQGLSVDRQGRIYIANTGFNTVVRCDWQGKGVVFSSTGKPYLDGLELARDVAIIQGKVLIPGGKSNAISVYNQNGVFQGALAGYFSPIQLTEFPQENTFLVTEPILASLQLHKVNLRRVQHGRDIYPDVLVQVGDERDSKGQLHFATSAAGDIASDGRSASAAQSPTVMPWFSREQVGHLEQQQEKLLKLTEIPGMPTWLNMGLNWQMEWMQRWQRSWLSLLMPSSNSAEDESLWVVDAGNYQLQSTDNLKSNSLRSTSMPLLPGSLGITSLTPLNPFPGQFDPEIPLLVVSNFLSGIVTIYQYHPFYKELIPYTAFGSQGHFPWQLNKPQGLAIDPVSRDIFIADSGNNRIARWRLNRLGIVGLVDTFGILGDGDDQFHTPSDIAVSDDGLCYISDQFNHRIQVTDVQGRPVRRFGQPGYGTDDDHFLLPTSVEFEQGYLFVSDLVNRAVKVFDRNDQCVSSFAAFGADSSKGQLWMPYLMHVRNRRIYLPDCALNRVNVYHFDAGDQA
ncbi:hypothetical protein [Oceanospirillum sp.]|uniref:hypothetical protein n=1 Tax=Oceanospirillum sp. TaxID=2021254 RepID=UPI003A8EA490